MSGYLGEYLEVSEILRNIHIFYLAFPTFLLKRYSVLCQKQSSSTITHSKNTFHITKSDKVAIPKWRVLVTSKWLNFVLKSYYYNKIVENFGLSDSKSVYFYEKNKKYLEGFSRYLEKKLVNWEIVFEHFRKYI